MRSALRVTLGLLGTTCAQRVVTAWQLRARPSFSTHGDEEQLVRRRLCDGSLLAQAAKFNDAHVVQTERAEKCRYGLSL